MYYSRKFSGDVDEGAYGKRSVMISLPGLKSRDIIVILYETNIE